MNKPKSKHGGWRPGAGRPAADNAKDLTQLTVYVEQSDITTAEDIGDGNKSLGVRRALKQARKVQAILMQHKKDYVKP